MRTTHIIAALAASLTGLAFAAQTPLVDIAQLSTRGAHSCVVTTSGGAKCWGSNSSGQLGGGPTGTSRPAASDVVGLTSGVIAVAAADGAHSCAIISGGAVKCWGANTSGQLGDGTTTNRPEPVDVQGLPWPAVAIAGGAAHTCAISAGGAMACWGRNNAGQLGDGTTNDRLTPALVAGLGAGAIAISASVSYTCAITTGGGLKCWGENFKGQLGDGSTTARSVPVDVVGLGTGVTSVATAGDPGAIFHGPEAYTCAAVAGGVKCWGSNAGSTPADVPGAGTDVAAITQAGARVFTFVLNGSYAVMHACFVTAGGGARCWGDNYCGMVGNGATVGCNSTSSYTNIPPAVDVVGLTSGVASVSAAGTFTCALLTAGQVRCWGAGYGSTAVTVFAGTSPQAIFFGAPTPVISVGSSAGVNVSGGGSGNPVVLSSLTPGTCSVSGTTVTGVAGGPCTIAADQAGSLYYDPAPQATLSFQVDPRQAQQIFFNPPTTLGAPGIFLLGATSSSNRPVNFSLSAASVGVCAIDDLFLRTLAVGTCSLIASLPGDSSYTAAAKISVDIQVVSSAGSRPMAIYGTGGGAGTITLSIGGSCRPPCAGNLATGDTVTLTPVADSGSTFEGWSGACSGTSPCSLTMDAARTVTARFASSIPRLVNLSTRGWVFSGNDVLIGGFIIGGPGNKKVILRARGSSLGALGVTPALADPSLTLVRSSDRAVIATNEDIDQPTVLANDSNSGVVRSQAAIESLGFGPLGSREAAMLMTLPPGAYTAIVSPRSAPGIALFEIFEVDLAESPLINVSTRGRVGPGNDVMIAGFIIQGGPQTVIVRGRGPSMASLGVPDTLANPMLQLVRSSDQVVIAVNDNWQDSPNAAAIAASGFAPTDELNREAAIMMTLPPGAYTAILSGVGGTAGTGLVEVFRVGN